jgi:anti-sigma factor RsiW
LSVATALFEPIFTDALSSWSALHMAWRGLVAAASLLFVVLILWRAIPGVRKEEDYQAEFAAGIVDAHLRSLLPGQLTNVISSDPETVRTWFDSKVKFIFPVRDFTDDDFALRGGRVDIVQGRTVAALSTEAVTTSEIEGEILDRTSVQSLRPEKRVAVFAFLIQESVAGALNSKEEVSWIVLCSVRYSGQRIA